MKTYLAVLAGVLLAGMAWSQPAAAQGLPQGSYLRSCAGATLQGDTLVATCRRSGVRQENALRHLVSPVSCTVVVRSCRAVLSCGGAAQWCRAVGAPH